MQKQTKYRFLALALLFCATVRAQVFPVNATPQLIPPYSLKLPEYTTATTDKVFLNLLLTDITESNRRVRLKLFIENNAGLSVQSSDVVVGAFPIFLDGGVPLRLGNIDLQPYFALQNLRGIAPQQYSRTLPEGLYGFCFEVYDALSGRQISRKGCARVYLALANPPFLIMPGRGELVAMKDPQNIFFNWSPGTPAGTRVTYGFTLAELWDDQMDPQAAFLASRPLYQATTDNNVLLYGPAEPQLLAGKKYGWRVRAIATDGVSETSVFKNNGYSEIFHFTYAGACEGPGFVLAEAKGPTSEKILWQGVDHDRYNVQYRKKGAERAVWFETGTVNQYTTIYNLEPGTTYEFRVGGQCLENTGYTYSQVYEFTTTLNTGETATYNCGITPEIVIANQEPLESLMVNDVFTAGDFPVTVKEVNYGNVTGPTPIGGSTDGGGGVFSGWGYIVVPYLEDTKLKVGFDRIRINTDYQLIDGVVVTDYDENWGGVDGIGDELAALESLAEEIRGIINQLFSSGQITEERRDAEKGELEQLEASSRQAREGYETSAENLGSVKEGGTQEEISQAQEEVEEKERTVSEARRALEQKSKELKSLSKDGGLQEDPTGFFDGYLPITYTGDGILIEGIDNEKSFMVPVAGTPAAQTTFYKGFTRNIEGTSYTFIFTSSASNAEDIRKARGAVNNPKGDIAIYFHYDTDNSQLGYKVEMSSGYFGPKVNDEGFEWSRAAFKRGIKNMVDDINAVGDWSAEILDIAHRLNKNRIKPLLAEAKMPEEMWDPDASNYNLVPIHVPPLGAGLTDGALEEITGIPQLISLVIDYTTDDQVRQQIDQAWEDLDAVAVVEYAKKFVEDRSGLYETGATHQIQYQSGKDVVGLATAASGIGATIKALKGSAEFVKDLVGKVKKKVAKGVTNTIPKGKLANHLFKGTGKLADTPANRALIQKISNGKPLGVDQYGKAWYTGVDGAGKSIYSYTRNGVVKGAGYMNMTPAEMIAKYGLK